jgi:hypothetical protein
MKLIINNEICNATFKIESCEQLVQWRRLIWDVYYINAREFDCIMQCVARGIDYECFLSLSKTNQLYQGI